MTLIFYFVSTYIRILSNKVVKLILKTWGLFSDSVTNATLPLKLKIFWMRNLGLQHLFPVIKITTREQGGVSLSNHPRISNEKMLLYTFSPCNFLSATSAVSEQYKFLISRQSWTISRQGLGLWKALNADYFDINLK